MIRAAVFALLSVLLIPGLVAAQPPSVDPIRELLTEVRALRLAMERQATVGARIQLLVARIQLQEQRIAELSRRAAAVRDELSKIDAGLAASSADLSRMEHELERVTDVSRRQRNNCESGNSRPGKSGVVRMSPDSALSSPAEVSMPSALRR